ncbi:UNVERIFIED_CONTAM: hypothetical protein FKN15_023006 [Acipenser sinensis]
MAGDHSKFLSSCSNNVINGSDLLKTNITHKPNAFSNSPPCSLTNPVWFRNIKQHTVARIKEHPPASQTSECVLASPQQEPSVAASRSVPQQPEANDRSQQSLQASDQEGFGLQKKKKSKSEDGEKELPEAATTPTSSSHPSTPTATGFPTVLRTTPLPPLPPGSPPSREIGDWLVHPEGKMEGWRDGCRDLEDLLGGLEDQGWCMACGVQGHTVAICPFQGEEEEQQPGCYCCAEPGHSSTNCTWYPLGQLPQRCPICGDEHFVAHCPVHQEREEQESPQSPPPAGGGRLLLPPPQPQVQQRPEEPENLFPWCTWCGEVDHRWRDCSEVPPSWCGRCEEGGHDWSGCPYASSPVPKREEPERPQPKEEEVGASIALGPKLPAEGECLLVPPPPAEEKCLLSPCAPAEDECLLVSLPPPAEGECLLGPRPPAEDECLLVTLPQPAEDECLLVTLPQPAEDECLLVTLPQPAEDECLLVTLPQPAEDECLLVTLPQLYIPVTSC